MGSDKRFSQHTDQRVVVSSVAWCEHFQRSAAAPTVVDWTSGAGISPEECRLIARSVQTFQLGESGEGRHLLRSAEVHAKQTGDAEYVTAVRLFVAEEQRHARELGGFLDAAGIPRLRKEWSDHFFRRLRHLAGLELSITVLLTAELLSNVYYAALREATGSAGLRQVCGRLLKDEVAHIRFQCERLAILRRRRWKPALWLTHVMSWVLFWIVGLVVWQSHRPVFRLAGLSFKGYMRKGARELAHGRDLMDPGTYAWHLPVAISGGDLPQRAPQCTGSVS